MINFIHGWGFNKEFWQPIAEQCQQKLRVDTNCLDLGFYGEKQTSPITNSVVCHSYGLMWFLLRNPKFGGRILAFNATPCLKENLDKRDLKHMAIRFNRSAIETLEEFLGLYGASPPPNLKPNIRALAEALRELATKDATTVAIRMGGRLRLVWAADDEILRTPPQVAPPQTAPPQTTKVSQITTVDKGGHLLPLRNPTLAVKLIRQHLEL